MPESAGTREEILRIALDLFRSQGYDGTSLRQIAERLGITKAAVYYHFRAKEQIVAELTRPFLDGFAALVVAARARDVDAPPTSTEELIGQYLDLLVEHHEVLNAIVNDPAMVNNPDVGMRGRMLVRSFEAELVGPDPTEAARLRAACALGAVNAAAGVPLDAIAGARETVLRAALAALGSGDA